MPVTQPTFFPELEPEQIAPGVQASEVVAERRESMSASRVVQSALFDSMTAMAGQSRSAHRRRISPSPIPHSGAASGSRRIMASVPPEAIRPFLDQLAEVLAAEAVRRVTGGPRTRRPRNPGGRIERKAAPFDGRSTRLRSARIAVHPVVRRVR